MSFISKSYLCYFNILFTNFHINFSDPITITTDSDLVTIIIIIAINFMDKNMDLYFNFINYRAVVVINITIIGIIIATAIVTSIVTAFVTTIVTTIVMVITIIVVIVIGGFVIIETTTITVTEIIMAIKSIAAILFNLNCIIEGTNYFTINKNIID